MVKAISTIEEARKLRPGEPARWKPGTLKLAERPIEEEYRCSACGCLFYMEKAPKFCPGCGARWNGKGAAVAVEEG